MSSSGSRKNHYLMCWIAIFTAALQGSLVYSFSAGQRPATLADNAPEIYSRSASQFNEARLFKPFESTMLDLNYKLAPLILQEIQPAGNGAGVDRFGTLYPTNGQVALDLSRPAVYYTSESVELNGRAHARFTFVWVCSLSSFAQRALDIAAQGVRITLDNSGQPAIWEVLSDPAGAKLFFVSRELEAAATNEFGAAVPGRRYAIERSWNETPNSIVARVIEAGPVPMGPIVYLRAQKREVSTLICRCMPAQCKSVSETGTYELISLAEESTHELMLRAGRLMRNTKGTFLFEDFDRGRSDVSRSDLRLPKSF